MTKAVDISVETVERMAIACDESAPMEGPDVAETLRALRSALTASEERLEGIKRRIAEHEAAEREIERWACR